jgi:hypothetical protein
MNAPSTERWVTALAAAMLWACGSSDHHDPAASTSEVDAGGMHPSGTGGATLQVPDAGRTASKDAGHTASKDAGHTASKDAGHAVSKDAGPAPAARDAALDATPPASGCAAPGLVWKTANKTTYTSYPDPGSEECIKYSGCEYEGMFAACDDTKPKSWVMSHDIVAAFPDFDTLQLHDLCLRSGSKTIVVTVIDTCGDSDCDGCCTENKGNADELIDIESFTDARWGVEDGRIEWADLGPTQGGGCE